MTHILILLESYPNKSCVKLCSVAHENKDFIFIAKQKDKVGSVLSQQILKVRQIHHRFPLCCTVMLYMEQHNTGSSMTWHKLFTKKQSLQRCCWHQNT